MKPLLFIATTTATIYGSLRYDAVFYVIVALFVGGAAFAIFHSIYRHLVANRLL